MLPRRFNRFSDESCPMSAGKLVRKLTQGKPLKARQPSTWQSYDAKGLSLICCSTPARIRRFRTKKAAQSFIWLQIKATGP